ncbi:hypothetical protein [Streptomyces sp. NPDC059479]|uniref:hypothetical protein n=1 Tax=Streptomyces sp. NPDC059479 TaxID=3346848 RepID=UPI00368F68F7
MPGKPRLPKVAAAGDLLHYATVREQWERRGQGEGSKGQRSYAPATDPVTEAIVKAGVRSSPHPLSRSVSSNAGF